MQQNCTPNGEWKSKNMCTASIFQHAAVGQHSGYGQILSVLSFAMLFPCFSHALLHVWETHTHTHTHYCTNSSPQHIVLYNTIKAQPVVFCWFLQFDTYMLHSVAVMARAIVSAVYVYFCRLVNSILFCDFTAAVFSWDDSSTGDRDADSRHLTNRLPGLPFPIPGPAQSRERCQCAAGPGSLH